MVTMENFWGLIIALYYFAVAFFAVKRTYKLLYVFFGVACLILTFFIENSLLRTYGGILFILLPLILLYWKKNEISGGFD